MQYGIGVPKGSVAHDAKEAEQVAKGIGMIRSNDGMIVVQQLT